jgi:ABC-type transport system involved in multi-copper enzyme maturation permease subunit
MLAAFELRVQSRDFLAWLAALVFFLLTFGYASGGVIVLVNGLGDSPRNAPWAVAQAMAGVTAFGQVITAMIAATTVLRDVGTRSQDLLLATPLPWRAYLGGRFVGTLLVLLVIYAAIPLGLLAGDLVATWGAAPPVTTMRLSTLMAPTAWLVVPNVLVVAAVFFSAGALAGGFTVILFVGLGLIGCWQTGLALAAAGNPLGALVDPFGNAALTIAGVGWSSADRAERAVALTPLLLANRALWLGLGGALLAATFRWWRPRASHGQHVVALPVAAHTSAAPRGALSPLRGAPWWAVVRAEILFGWRWVLRERGFAALLLLAVLNAAVNGWRVADDPSALVRSLEYHARLFGILIATIYAGELVWRDRDVRAAEMLRALPASPGGRLIARASGVGLALLALPAALWLVAAVLPLLQGVTPDPHCAARWLLGVSAPAFLGLLAVSLAVHRAVDHKTGAHLLLISAWVMAIALGVDALARPWQVWGHCG